MKNSQFFSVIGLVSVAFAGGFFVLYDRMSEMHSRQDNLLRSVSDLATAMNDGERLERTLIQSQEARRIADMKAVGANVLVAFDKQFPNKPIVRINPEAEGRKLYAIVDISCGFCKSSAPLIESIAEKGVSVTKIPVGMLGENSRSGAVSVLAVTRISADAGKVLLDDLMKSTNMSAESLASIVLASLEKNKISVEDYNASSVIANEELAQIEGVLRSAGVRGVPFYVTSDGTSIAGVPPDLEKRLGF